MTKIYKKITFIESLSYAFRVQRLLGLSAFAIRDGRFVTTKLTSFMQFIPLLIHLILLITIFNINNLLLVKILTFDSFINTQFTLITVMAITTHYALLTVSIYINKAEVEFYNKIIIIDNRLKSELNIEIDHEQFKIALRRITLPITLYAILTAILPYLLAERDFFLIFTVFFVLPDGLAISENIYFFLVIRLVNSRFTVLGKHFKDNLTAENIVQRFIIANDIYFEICDLIRFMSDIFGFRLLFNLAKDFTVLVSLCYMAFWNYSDTHSLMSILPILVATFPYWTKLAAVACVCHHTTILVRNY